MVTSKLLKKLSFRVYTLKGLVKGAKKGHVQLKVLQALVNELPSMIEELTSRYEVKNASNK